MNYITSMHIEMPGRCILHVLLALSSLILSEEKHAGPSCLRASPADEGRTRVTFLREDAAGVRSLYTSLWSEDTRLPLTCEVDTDPLVTERYRSVCGDGSGEITGRFDVGALLAPDAPCALVSSGAPKFGEGKVRRRRAWIFPGTLWCGTGSRAGGYEQLGMFKSADRCCRDHDHCLQIIQALTVNYGAYNPNFFTISHCDCDQRFRECLLGVNDTISRMVGYSFFNILRVPCFQLKHQKHCTERHSWGKCKVSKRTPYAVFQSPLPYFAVISKHGANSTDNSTTSVGQNATENFVTSPRRKSPKGEHRCSSRYPPMGDTFYLRTTKERGCKRHRKLHKAAPSRVNATTPSMTTSLLNAFKRGALTANKKRAGKEKNARKSLSVYPTQRSHVSPQRLTTFTTQSTPSLTLELHLTSITADTKTTRSRQNVSNQSHCCGFKTPLRGDTFQPHCKGCTTSHMMTHGLPVKGTTARTLTESPKQGILKRLWSAAMSGLAVTTNLKPAASMHEDGKPQQQTDSPLRRNSTSREPVGTVVQSTHAGRGLKRNSTLHNVTDNQLLCGSLKHLDECKYKIRPLQKKYDLQNTESKTSYHCDCTSRLAVQLRSFKQPSVLPELLMDFVSPHCFKLPKEKKCHGRKSCSGGFSKASDLLEALKMIDEKDTAGVQNSGNDRRRGIPTRLFKRCLRLEREAGVMAHAHTVLD